MKLTTGLVAVPALALVLTSCAGLQTGFDVATFQKDDRSGITKGQEFSAIFYRSDKPGDMATAVSRELGVPIEGDLRDVMTANCRFQGQREFLPASLTAASLFTSLAGQAFEAITQSITSQAKKIAAASQQSYTARYVSAEGKADWHNTGCLLLVRVTSGGPGDPTGARRVGMAILYKRTDLHTASVLTPVFWTMNNAVAWTQKGTDTKKPTIKLNVGFVVDAVILDSKTGSYKSAQTANIAMPAFKASIGQSGLLCGGFVASSKSCSLESALIPRPPNAPLSITLKVVETGTSANANQQAAAAVEALNGIAKPAFDELVKQIAAGISG